MNGDTHRPFGFVREDAFRLLLTSPSRMHNGGTSLRTVMIYAPACIDARALARHPGLSKLHDRYQARSHRAALRASDTLPRMPPCSVRSALCRERRETSNRTNISPRGAPRPTPTEVPNERATTADARDAGPPLGSPSEAYNEREFKVKRSRNAKYRCHSDGDYSGMIDVLS